jgi:hypothetical protein
MTKAQLTTKMTEALDYEAPFLEEKLLKDRVVDTVEEARALFIEVKRYVVLGDVDKKIWTMYSHRVDEAWHQFVLFTVEYTKFCNQYFGRYIHHSPSNAPEVGGERNTPRATRAEFAERYREVFGIDLPQIWDDSTGLRPHRRVFNDHCGQLRLDSIDGRVELTGPHGKALLRVSDIAADALQFVATTGAFYVRELPGELSNGEKVRLVSALVDVKVLRVG